MWKSIPFDQLYDKIIQTENRLMGESEGFWKIIRIIPEKWQCIRNFFGSSFLKEIFK